MLGILAINSCCIGVLRANLGNLPRSGILLMLKGDGKLPRFVIIFMLRISPVILYSRLCLMFR